MKRALHLAAGLAILGLGVGCDGMKRHDDHAHKSAPSRPMLMMAQTDASEAVAVLHPLGNSKVSGTVRFTQADGKVKVLAEVKGLTPNATHGFHVHEFGDCSAPDGSSAGGHYNPEGHAHAGPETSPRHAGDFGNLQADASGNARLELTVDNITIAGQKNPVIGRAVIVHDKPDDLKSQPTGNAGGRIACGVIGLGKAGKPATQPK